MQKRILLITNLYPSPEDVIYGRFVERTASMLKLLGCEVTVVSLGKRFNLVSKLLGYIVLACRANSKILFGTYDRIYLHYPLHTLLICLPALVVRAGNLVLNFHGHDLVPVTKRGLFIQKILERKISSAQYVITPSLRFKHIFDEKYSKRGAPSACVFYSGGVHDHYFESSCMPILQRGKTALFLSRFVEEKGWRTFLVAAQLLNRECVDFRFTLAGEGPDLDLIEKTVASMGLSDVVRVASANTVQANRALFIAHRYFIFPTQYDESLALVNLEAMACGCIVISSDFVASSEYIENGENGIRLPLNNFSEHCAEKIYALEEDPMRLVRLSKSARLTADSFKESKIACSLSNALGLGALE